jgi:alpha-glucosidase (family GH31 glycosyl hydrolase)
LIGGGEISSFIKPGFKPDQELFVRTAQCSTLFPIMQFSIAPWRILDQKHLADCLAMVALRKRMGPEIVALAQAAARSGEPIMRPLAYDFPDGGYEAIHDQFLLGSTILVAPVLQRGAARRAIVFPPERWIGDDGAQVIGPCTREVDAPVSRLPWYRRG